jgi:hypothetical protein
MPMEETQLQGIRARELECEQTRQDDQVRLHPSTKQGTMLGESANQEEVEALETACSTADLCLGGALTKYHKRFLPCSLASIAATITTRQTISQTARGVPTSHRCHC